MIDYMLHTMLSALYIQEIIKTYDKYVYMPILQMKKLRQ